jgi:uncharacterized repeat protein (TIGR01451 family)
MVAAFIAMPAAPAPVAAVSLGTVLSPEAPLSALAPVLGITITTNPTKVWACTEFAVTAKVCNTGDAVANNVSIKGKVTGDVTPSTLDEQTLGDICPGYCKEFTWTKLACNKPGAATIEITATYMNGCTPVSKTEQITIQQDCRFSVVITKPANGAQFAVSDQFAVHAVVTNNGDTLCDPVAVTLGGFGANAELIGGAATYTITIPAHESQEVNWTVHCAAQGSTDLVVHVESTCQTCAACDAKITVQQGPPQQTCALGLTITSQSQGKICVGSTFPVTGTVKNNGTATITNVHAILAKTSGQVTIAPAGSYHVGDLAPGASLPVSWTVTCTGRDIGQGKECLDEFVDLTADASGWCLSSTVNATQVVLNDYANQKFVIVTILPPSSTCNNFCINDEWLVDVSVKNCLPLGSEGSITISVSGGTGTIITPPLLTQEMALPAGATVKLSDAGGALPWHAKCTAAGDFTIDVTYLGVAGTTTLCDTDKGIVHQKNTAALGVGLVVPACATTCQEFDVTATITNTGTPPTNDATNVVATLSATGVTLVKGDNPANVGTVVSLTPKTVTWTVRCNSGVDASFSVGVTGYDAVCKKNLTASAGPEDTVQLDLGVVIISPLPCAIFHPSDTFCVTANVIDQDADTDFDNVNATITFSDTVELVLNETADKDVSFDNGGTQQVSWTMHCKAPGDADINVTVTGVEKDGNAECPITKSDEITVHQQLPTALEVVILSPTPPTCVMTCQEFAVTATVKNIGDATSLDTKATITFGGTGGASVVSPGAVIDLYDIAKGATKTATWTVHCDKGGFTTIIVTATGKDKDTLVIKTSSATTVVNQLPAASLKVDIDGNPLTVKLGDSFEITSTVWNTGEADASEVALTLSVMPEGSVRVSEGGYTQTVGALAGHEQNGFKTVTWKLVCKAVSNSTITVTPSGRDEFGWKCTLFGPIKDAGAQIQGAALKSKSITVKQLDSGGLDLGITKTVDKAFPSVPSNVVYTVIVTNNGPTNASGVVVDEPLPAGLSYVSSSATQGSYNSATGKWTVGGLVVGAKATLTLTATVNNAGAITNTATVSSDQPDGVAGNNTASTTINRSVSDILLTTGWNLMSLPQIPTNGSGVKVTDINTILAVISGQVIVVWYYDPATGWHSFSPGGPVDLATMEDGKAYFMNMKAGGATLHINNGVDILPPPNLPPEYSVVPGWNMVGFKSTTARTAGDYLLACVGKCTRIYGMVNGAYFVLQPGENMVPGLGYWISFTANGTIFP